MTRDEIYDLFVAHGVFEEARRPWSEDEFSRLIIAETGEDDALMMSVNRNDTVEVWESNDRKDAFTRTIVAISSEGLERTEQFVARTLELFE